MIPLISWIMLKGRCRSCDCSISPLYPAIELLTGISLFTLYTTYPFYTFCSYSIFFSALIVTIRSDIETMLISRFVTLFLVPIGIFCAATTIIPLSLHASITGTFFGYFYLYSINYIYQKIKGFNGIGEGDFDLLALIGSFTGIFGVWFTILIGALLGIIIHLPSLLQNIDYSSTKIPFGPFLAAGAILFVLLQEYLINFL